MRNIQDLGKKKITLDEIEKEYNTKSYIELYRFIMKQLEQGNIEPISASGINGKKPALYNSYRILSKSMDYSNFQEDFPYLI